MNMHIYEYMNKRNKQIKSNPCSYRSNCRKFSRHFRISAWYLTDWFLFWCGNISKRHAVCCFGFMVFRFFVYKQLIIVSSKQVLF